MEEENQNITVIEGFWNDICPHTTKIYYVFSTFGMSTDSPDSIAFIIIVSLLGRQL